MHAACSVCASSEGQSSDEEPEHEKEECSKDREEGMRMGTVTKGED